ncbi:MAG: 2-hydroxy-3-oxopropionate reductase [bacterium]
MTEKPAVGFVGLGIMGKPMARNILKSGFALSVFNRTASKMDDVAKDGAHACQDLAELAARSQVVITMLPDSPEVQEVILGKNGLINSLRGGMTVIDMSSIAPLVSRDIAGRLATKNVEFLDAPVSGGETGAVAGSLAIMVGGRESVFNRCLPLLQSMGKSVVHVGPVGAGGYTKLVNQMIVAANIAAMGEAMTFAQKAGLDTQRVFEAIRGGLAGSKVLETKFPMVAQRNFEPGFKLKLHQKDLKNALDTAAELGYSAELTTRVQEMITALCNSGKQDLDHGAIVQYFEEGGGVEIGT